MTDQATFAWICDVYVEEAFRGRGIGGRLMTAILDDPRLQGLHRMILSTSSAAGLYEAYGFVPLEHPERWMERRHVE